MSLSSGLSRFRSLALAGLGLLALTLPAQADLLTNLHHVPVPVDGFVNLTTDRENWRFFAERKPFGQMWQQLRAKITPDLEARLGLNFDRDLLPLVGSHVDVAVYRADLATASEHLPLLLLLDVRDVQAYRQLLGRLKAVAAKDKRKRLLEVPYRGVSLYGFATTTTAEGVPFMALSGKTLLIGSKARVMQAIDAGQSQQPSALEDDGFRVSLNALKDHKLWFYANPRTLPELYARLGSGGPNRQREGAELAAAVEPYDALGFGIDINPNGLALRSVARVKQLGLPGDKQALLQGFQRLWNDPAGQMPRLLQAVPSRPLLFAGLNGLPLYDRALSLFGNGEQVKALDQLGAFFTATTQLDFHRDLLDYSDGRAGLAIYYPDDVRVPNRPPQAVCYLGVRDNAAFLQNLQQRLRLDLSFLADGLEGTKPQASPARVVRFPTQPTEIYAGHPLYVAQESPMVKKLREGLFMQPAYGNYGNLWLFASSPAALKAGIDNLNGRNGNLNSSPYFNQLRRRIGVEPGGGLMFVEFSSLAKLAELLGGEDEDFKALRPSLQAFHSILAGGSYRDNVIQGNLVMDIDMAKVNFELIGRIFNSHSDTLSDPTRKPQPAASRAPGAVKPGPHPRTELGL